MDPIPKDNQQYKAYEEMKNILKNKHREIPSILLALNEDKVRDLIRNPAHLIYVKSDLHSIKIKVANLAEQICKTPSTFQYNECHLNTSLNKIYEGFITPGKRQYWAMYPEYFVDSCNVEIKVNK